ncbi:NUDIX domain-containing protein [Allosaccharopolyspora coralli]|uniref:NUDIX domain-containing protein n=1 Tax=Allosaccharopolyspora coralli TaxID=2665642 RepID=A0A5Q3QLG7_9PSEU|nr:NUDIX domain-containing protein [Allosaccharopolyspora coralli]
MTSRRSPDDEFGPAVRAAGAVLWRDGKNGAEVAVVHRPRYDDWSLPKGKLDKGELAAEAAVREVREETGFECVLQRTLRQVRYPVPAHSAPQGTATKVVDYFAAHSCGGEFVAGNEVDELRWIPVAQAPELLTYPHDGTVVDAFTAVPTDVHTLLLVRHAKAGKRSDWHDDDTLRPLTDAGRAQRDVLHRMLPLFGPRRVHSAPRTRCVDTVAPVAADLGVDVVAEPLLSEEGYAEDPAVALRRLIDLARLPGTSVVCSQGGVIPDVVESLLLAEGHNPGEVPSKKGSVWTLTLHGGSATNGTGPGLRLVTADYVPEP